jgi:hypothetical protein
MIDEIDTVSDVEFTPVFVDLPSTSQFEEDVKERLKECGRLGKRMTPEIAAEIRNDIVSMLKIKSIGMDFLNFFEPIVEHDIWHVWVGLRFLGTEKQWQQMKNEIVKYVDVHSLMLRYVKNTTGVRQLDESNPFISKFMTTDANAAKTVDALKVEINLAPKIVNPDTTMIKMKDKWGKLTDVSTDVIQQVTKGANNEEK